MPAAGDASGSLAEHEAEVQRLAVAADGQVELVARLAIEHRALEIQGPMDFRLADRGDHVACLEAGFGGGALLLDRGDFHSRERCGGVGSSHQPVPRLHAAGRQKRGRDVHGLIDRDGKADALAPARTATLTPIISPSMFSSGPPELPGLMGASVWIRSS